MADVKEPINVKESHRSFTSKLTCDVLETFGDYGSKQKSVKVTDEDKNAYTVSQILGKVSVCKCVCNAMYVSEFIVLWFS